MPRSRTEDTGETVVEPTVSVVVGSRFWRRLVVHHSSSVFPGFISDETVHGMCLILFGKCHDHRRATAMAYSCSSYEEDLLHTTPGDLQVEYQTRHFQVTHSYQSCPGHLQANLQQA